jgi:uncharacterized protein YfbU (UPF0304 family)
MRSGKTRIAILKISNTPYKNTAHIGFTLCFQPFLNGISRYMRLRGYSGKTEKTYLHWIRYFIRFQQRRHPVHMAQLRLFSFWIPWPATKEFPLILKKLP